MRARSHCPSTFYSFFSMYQRGRYYYHGGILCAFSSSDCHELSAWSLAYPSTTWFYFYEWGFQHLTLHHEESPPPHFCGRLPAQTSSHAPHWGHHRNLWQPWVFRLSHPDSKFPPFAFLFGTYSSTFSSPSFRLRFGHNSLCISIYVPYYFSPS